MVFTKTLVGINAVVMGWLTLSMVRGPFSSFEQELWYRYGSLAFFFLGVVLPVVAMVLFRAKVLRFAAPVNVWLIAIMVGFVVYLTSSGGGV